MNIHYRVDRANSEFVPCGMNSIQYLGSSFKEARKVFNSIPSGYDVWNKPNSTYGLILSIWNEDTQDYVIKISKGI
jgi:hypothetical protein